MLPLRGGLAPLTLPTKVPAIISWWLSGGISAANAIAAYAPKGAASLAASYTNLANVGTYTAAPGTAPTWDATNGWTFNGSSQYLRNGITLGVAYTVIVRFTGFTANNVLFGAFFSAAAFAYERYNGYYYENGPAVAGTEPTSGAGIIAIAGKSGYLNGVFDKTIGAGNPPNIEMFIGAQNRGSPQLYAACSIQGMSIYNTTLTAAQVLAVTNAMAAI